MARLYESQGDMIQASQYYSRAVDITPELYVPLIKRLLARNISYIIAPYEADAELAYLSRNHLVDFVITEDSDLLPLGCDRVFFKLGLNGIGDEVCRENIFLSDSFFADFTEDMFLSICILAGCDYLDNPQGYGFKRLAPLVRDGRTPEQIIRLVRITIVNLDESCVFL